MSQAYDLDALTPSMIAKWCTAAAANNTVRHRITTVLSFLRWCEDEGYAVPNRKPIEKLRRSYPKTYGKVQDRNPARFLTHEQAFADLLDACRYDQRPAGLRDGIILRLGLAGVRASEITAMQLGNLHLDDEPPTIAWMGKGRRPRRLSPHVDLVADLRRYLALYAEHADLSPTGPLICRTRNGSRGNQLDWGTALKPGSNAVWFVVNRRSAEAGLGHVAPHDLRRTCAAVLHRSTTPDGAHYFDLRDVQQVLGHADPATTMKSYLEPLDTEVFERAAKILG